MNPAGYEDALQRIEGIAHLALETEPPPPPPPQPGPGGPPPLSLVVVRPPGTVTVFARPEIVTLPITARLQGDMIHISWPPLMRGWALQWRNLGQGRKAYFGNSGLIYRNKDGIWVADATEWMREGREDEGTSYPFDEKWRHGEPDFSYPIGLFVAGPWRYSADRPEWYHRTTVRWFDWPKREGGILTPATWAA